MGIILLPQNLAAMGVKRRTPDGIADIETVWDTTYPVITPYVRFCAEAGLSVFGGGTRKQQGAKVPGYITSAFRDLIREANSTSLHLYALALDILIGFTLREQVRCATIALKYFTRVGLYPGDGFIHVDQAPDCWIERYNKARCWIRLKGTYHSLPNLHGMLVWLKEHVDKRITL